MDGQVEVACITRKGISELSDGFIGIFSFDPEQVIYTDRELLVAVIGRHKTEYGRTVDNGYYLRVTFLMLLGCPV